MSDGGIPTHATSAHRWALALVAATFLLILAGGLVTSRDAGLAVPDWPLSYGTLNPPRWYAIENVRTEHGHRLVAGCVALLTAVVAWRVSRSETRPAVRRLAAACVAAVLFQALLGGLRVLHLSVDLAMVHGCIAQIFLCLVVALAVVTSPLWPDRPAAPVSSALRTLSPTLTAIIALQLVVGILIRHGSGQGATLTSNPLFYAHAVGAMLVVGVALALQRRAEHSTAYLARRARLLVGLVLAQVSLGVLTWAVVEGHDGTSSASLLASWIPSFHVATGAAVLATSVAVMLHALRAPKRSTTRVSPRVAEVL